MSSIDVVNLLESRPGSYKPLFSPLPIHDVLFFDEGPQPAASKETSSQSGSIDTSRIDRYTQGVELTRQSRYDAGLVKIWSGEAGHHMLVNQFGAQRITNRQGFSDKDLFNPFVYINVQDTGAALSSIFTFPIVTSDFDQEENINYDGIIEPLTIRSVISFSSIENPESHATRGAVMNGNVDIHSASDLIQTIEDIDLVNKNNAYIDMVDMLGSQSLGGFFEHKLPHIMPFSDARLVRNVPAPDNEPVDMLQAMSMMTGSTDNYIRYKQRSATCGWYYDNNAGRGTDSLAFGGMTY